MTELLVYMKLMLLILFLLNHNIVFGQQQPSLQPTDAIYDECWKIESDPPCNDPYYADFLGCHWDIFDLSCMCRIEDNNMNVIYLVDISTSASPQQSDFDNVAALIQDVTDSTLFTNATTTMFNQIILYDENQYIQAQNTDASTININDISSRTQLVDLRTAINSAIQQFNTLNNRKRRVLVIFDGQAQSDYTDDDTEICPIKATLNDEGNFNNINYLYPKYKTNISKIQIISTVYSSSIPGPSADFNNKTYRFLVKLSMVNVDCPNGSPHPSSSDAINSESRYNSKIVSNAELHALNVLFFNVMLRIDMY